MMWLIVGTVQAMVGSALLWGGVVYNFGLGFAVGLVLFYLSTECIRRWLDGSRDY